jgi:ABC-type molybdate transport system substrate-binding protein
VRNFLVLIFLSFGLLGASLSIGVAAEYESVFGELCEAYEKDSGVTCTAISGPSQKMRQNISSKAPFDIYFDSVPLGNSIKFAKVWMGVASYSISGESIQFIKDAKIKKVGVLTILNTEYQKASVQLLKSEVLYDEVWNKCALIDNVSALIKAVQSRQIDAVVAPYSLLLSQKISKPKVLILSKNFNHGDIFLSYQKISQGDEALGFIKFLRGNKANAIIQKYGLTAL